MRIVRENRGLISGVYIFSPGGDFYEAMKLGRAIRDLELSTMVPVLDSRGRPTCSELSLATPKDPRNCTAASAAFLVYLGGVHRGGTYLATHRPTFTGPQLGQMTQPEARMAFERMVRDAQAYMNEMGVPQHLQDRVLSTPPDRVWLIEEAVIRQYFLGAAPYRAEWLKGRCASLSAEERSQLDRFRERSLASSTGSRSPFSVSETAEYRRLQDGDDAQRKCEIAASQISRAEAFVRTFGAVPGDAESHNFSRWPEATRYLGKRYYEIVSEERFEESTLGRLSFLTRNITATAPFLSLSDASDSPRIVHSVSVISPSNPSSDFIAKVLATLRTEWGEPDESSTEKEEWSWTTPSFRARLLHDTPAADGRHLVLRLTRRPGQ